MHLFFSCFFILMVCLNLHCQHMCCVLFVFHFYYWYYWVLVDPSFLLSLKCQSCFFFKKNLQLHFFRSTVFQKPIPCFLNALQQTENLQLGNENGFQDISAKTLSSFLNLVPTDLLKFRKISVSFRKLFF